MCKSTKPTPTGRRSTKHHFHRAKESCSRWRQSNRSLNRAPTSSPHSSSCISGQTVNSHFPEWSWSPSASARSNKSSHNYAFYLRRMTAKLLAKRSRRSSSMWASLTRRSCRSRKKQSSTPNCCTKSILAAQTKEKWEKEMNEEKWN